MKKAILGILVTSVLIAGCGASDADPAPDNRPTASVTSEYLTQTNQNLLGICNAITEYGLPADEQTDAYVRREVGQLDAIAAEQPDLRTAADRSATEIIEGLAIAFTRCDPEMSREIRDMATSG